MLLAPERLAELLRCVGSPLASAEAITSLGGLPSMRAFRLVVADGRVFKARLLESAERAVEVQRLVALAGAEFSRVLARDGDMLLKEWVPGRALGPADEADPELLARCGALLGRLHAQPAPAGAATRGVAWAAAHIATNLELAERHAALPADMLRDARRLLDTSRPAAASAGLVHVDFCGENLVLTPSGSLACVDIATLTVGPHDYDLARTWYRWPLDAPGRRAFLAGYEAHRSAATFHAQLPFWALEALLVSVAYRARFGLPGLAAPVAALGRLLDAPSSERAADAVFGPLASRR